MVPPGAKGQRGWRARWAAAPCRRFRDSPRLRAGRRERFHNVLWTGSHRGPERKDRRMGCLVALLAGFAPRVALALVWIFTNLVDRAFNGFLIPLLGLIVFPYATLFYVLAYSPV